MTVAERSTSAVIGGAGGIGGALVAALRARDRGPVVTLGRQGCDIALDLADEPAIAAAAAALGRIAADADAPLRHVIVATGVLHAPGVVPERSLAAVTPDALATLFQINATGPLLCLKHLAPLLPRHGRSVFAILSARIGSIGDNRLGGWIGYRASKAAVHMIVRTAAIELARTRPEAICVALHPGTVATALSAPFRGARRVFTPGESADHLLAVVDALDPARSGEAIAWDGTTIPP